MVNSAVDIQNIFFAYGSAVRSAASNGETAALDAATGTSSAIDGISLSVQKGECVLLTGISGCGKTSLLRAVNGLIPNYYEGKLSGEIRLFSENSTGKPIYDISKTVATVFQNPKSQFFNLDTTSEIVFALENTGTAFEKMRERLDFVSKFLHIEHLLDRNIFNLSGGEKQMIAIASALASDTDILLFDEPTSNLDLYYIEKIADVLRFLKEAGKTLIISEHRLYFLKDIIDRAFLIKDGKIAQSFTRKEFAALSGKKRKELLLRPVSINERTFECPADERMRPLCPPSTAPLSSVKSSSLHIEQLSYRFPKDKRDFLDVRNLQLDFGKIIALTGKNGQGKSTLAQCLTGLLKSRTDEVFIDGKKTKAAQRLKISYMVLQDVGYQLFTESVADEIELGKNKPRSSTQTAPIFTTEEILQKMNLSEVKERHPLSLSGGQKQRVSIGAAVGSGAHIIIMDEPTSGMDYFHMKETARLINSIRSPENLILIISHDFEFLSLVADEVVLMEKGGIACHGAFDNKEAERLFNLLKNG
ncbi:ABC transporter ATP-binding protein [Treponema sp. OMZ 840]|uniref:ABC transporter ATP-binding protein n=1 Tax=Treponema sp. OMZ 840 TaxID=244313 RepID=UPI003D8ED499